MKILISAFACAPGIGSEPAVGWGVVQAIQEHHQVWVLTNFPSEPLIEPKRSEVPNVTFVYIKVPFLKGYRKPTSLSHKLYYAIWQILAAFTANRLNRRIRFDLAHHVTYASALQTTFIGWIGIPFIWGSGPIDTTPFKYLRYMTWRSCIAEILRNTAIFTLGAATRFVSGFHARVILTPSAYSLAFWQAKQIRLPIGALSDEEIIRLKSIPLKRSKSLRIVSIGRLVGLKGFALGILAFSKTLKSHPNTEYWIVGDGPERSYLEKLAKLCGCHHAVTFWGEKSRAEVFQFLTQADVLLHPSMHEQFGYVLVEAMAAGRPVICLDRGGPDVLVTEECGIKLSGNITPEELIHQLVAAMNYFSENPEARLKMGLAGREVVIENWNWKAQGQKLLRLYDQIAR